MVAVSCGFLIERGQQGTIAARIVGIEHGTARDARLGRRGIERAEEQRLGCDIGVTRAVKIEMLVGDVGHGGNVEVDGGHARLGQPMAGALDHGVAAAGVDHFRKETLYLGRIGRGDVQTRVALAALDACADGRDHADTPVGCAASAVAAARIDSSKVQVVVLPSVPVTPTTGSLRLGKS